MKFKFPGIKILDRYIIRKFLGTYVFAIALIIVVVVTFDCVEKIDDFIELKAPLSKIAFQYYLNFIPFFINQFSGLFTFISVIFFTSKMAYQTEIISILSSGVSFRRLIWPYMLSAVVITLFSIGLNLWVIPAANQQRSDFEGLYLKKRRNVKYERHIYRQIYPGTFAYIRGYSDNTNRASYLSIESFDGSALTASLEAADVTFDPETKRWSAPRYLTRAFEGEAETFERRENLDTMINLDAAELGRITDLIKSLNISDLSEFLVQQRNKGSDMVAMIEVERQNRFAYPISAIILTIIGVSLSSRKVRGGTGFHIGVGIALCFSYILFSKFAEEFAKGGLLPPVISVWLPNFIYLFVAVYLYRKAPK